MKKAPSLVVLISCLLAVFILFSPPIIAKSNPQLSIPKVDVFERVKKLDNGISISWLEQTWDETILDKTVIKVSDFQLLKQLGFKSIRLPVAFECFQHNNQAMQKVWNHIDEILKLCKLYGFRLVICYHSGSLNENNYLTEAVTISTTWDIIAKRYIRESADILFFEVYNEPLHMNPQIWENAAIQVIAAIRRIDKTRTLIVGASNFNSIYELSRSTPFKDNNIIYTFHFYEPFFFTHQGAEWVGNQAATIGVAFPYNEENFPTLNPKAKHTWGETNYYQYRRDGNEQSVRDKLQIVKNWAIKYHLPILCGEYGVYNKYADLDSRCRYIKTVRQTLKELHIPGMLWDYNSNFSIFSAEPSLSNLSDCMKDAIGFTIKK